MIVSMTGFGTATGETPLGSFQVDIKTVNARYLEFNFRLPSALSSIEIPLRQVLSSKISRGKVDVFIKWDENEGIKQRVKINEEIIKDIVNQLSEISKKLGIQISDMLTPVLQLPYCVNVESKSVDTERLWQAIYPIAKQALESCYQFKVREGKILKRQISDSLKILRQYHQEIFAMKDTLIENYRKRLRQRVAEFKLNDEFKINQDRLEAEVLFFADRADISEELTRIKAHLNGFRKYLSNTHKGRVGKALDFLAQELLREINTIASKARDTAVSQRVLLMKNEVEKIREQLQNIE